MGTETRLIVTCCHQFVVGFVVMDLVILVKFTFHFLSVVLSAQLNLETGLSFNSIWLNTFVTFSRMDLETPAWNKRKSEVVPSQNRAGGSSTGGGRGRQRSRCSSATGRGAAHSVVGQRGRAEGIDHHRLQNLSASGSAMAEAGRFNHEAAGAIRDRPEAERAEAHEQLGPPFVHVWVAFLRSLAATKGLAPEHVSAVKTC